MPAGKPNTLHSVAVQNQYTALCSKLTIIKNYKAKLQIHVIHMLLLYALTGAHNLSLIIIKVTNEQIAFKLGKVVL